MPDLSQDMALIATQGQILDNDSITIRVSCANRSNLDLMKNKGVSFEKAC